MTRVVDLTALESGTDLRPQVLTTNQKQAERIVNAAQPAAVPAKNCFVYFAAFDGTHNDMANAGNAKNTNVAQLWTQFASRIGTANPDIDGNYFPGPGATGTLTNSSWLSQAVTRQVIRTAEDAYRDFAVKATNWLKKKPGGSVAAVLTAFSRGGASAAIFSQMLYERGLTDAIAPGQVPVSAGVLFDPVATGVSGNLAFAPNVSNIVNIRAQDEYRELFRAVDYSAQPCVVTVPMLGNHCNIGGGYENDGIAAMTLEAATTFLVNSGLPIGPVAASRKFNAGLESIAIHSEDVDDENAKWDVYAPGPQIESVYIYGDRPSPREADRNAVVARATEVTSDGSTVRTFLLYDGTSISHDGSAFTRTKPAGPGPDASSPSD